MMHYVTLLLLAMPASIRLASVRPPRCEMDSEGGFLNCTDRRLTSSVVFLNEEETKQVTVADFSLNRIKKIEEIDRYPMTKKISFLGNRIDDVPSDAFNALQALEEVDLSFNRIGVVDKFLFVRHKYLKSLKLQGNLLKVEADKPIICSASLQVLDLSTNGLFGITSENLLCLPSLSVLDLSSNSMTSLSPQVFLPLNNLRSINLRSNRFYCDCHLLELLKWSETKKSDLSTHDTDPVYCVLPNNKGRTQFDSVKKDLVCTPSTEISLPVPRQTTGSVAMKLQSENVNASSEFYDYILISYDTNVQNGEERVSTRYMGIISSKLYTIEALLSLVLFLLLVITGLLFCRHFRTVRDVSDNVSEYSAFENFLSDKMSTQLIQKPSKEPMYAHIK